ncbi:hypothetical protein [Allorhizocola rhizosphaerae]|uniref:hypothetical protein n=1 Tax=Allorhizocola rhizosphaerae TaxID=1872709 RepID=UPI0013C2F247|nr:hypothetical protein [Allorhizocola rhizosphaerae]
MDHPPGVIKTVLIDLTNVHIATLRHCDEAVLELSTRHLLHQIERHRANIGSGPPGRVD